jgi:sugar phosphate isomerase/epimerase
MARMVRKQIYIDEAQDRGLKELAADRGTTESSLVRAGVDAVLSGLVVRSRDEAWADLERFWAELDQRAAREGVEPAPRDWTRDDLYEDD